MDNKWRGSKSSNPGPTVKTKEAAEYLKLSPATLRNYRLTQDKGPVYVKSGRRVLYRIVDLEAYAKKHFVLMCSTGVPLNSLEPESS